MLGTPPGFWDQRFIMFLCKFISMPCFFFYFPYQLDIWSRVGVCSIYNIFKEILIKSNHFKLAKTAAIFHEDRYKGATIPAHFMKNSDSFFCA